MTIKTKNLFIDDRFSKTGFCHILAVIVLVSSFHITQSDALADSYRLEIKEASCSLCTLELVQKFASIKGVQDVIIEPQTQSVILKLYGDMTLSDEIIRQKVKEANLTLQGIKHQKGIKETSR